MRYNSLPIASIFIAFSCSSSVPRRKTKSSSSTVQRAATEERGENVLWSVSVAMQRLCKTALICNIQNSGGAVNIHCSKLTSALYADARAN
uniref:Putative secreted protein n=1 Tax=Anopheles marajoara TaxID=58244 RepID=A0A2M4C9X7_9DIPT